MTTCFLHDTITNKTENDGDYYMVTKIRLSDSLGLQLKEFRMQHQVKAKDIADFIGKSPAYVSKLEKGQIKQISKKELVKITNFITSSDDGYYLFCEKIASIANPKEFERDTLLLNFDLIERKLPISNEVINELRERMEVLNISSQDLAKHINLNEDLGSDFLLEHKIDINAIEKNIWIPYQEADFTETSRNFILLEYNPERIEKFINGKIQKCEYMFPFAMLYHLLKTSYKIKGKILDENLIKSCQEEAEQILLKHKFYSLSVQSRFGAQSNTKEEYKKLLSNFDVDNMEYISQILNGIHFLSSYDVEYTNKKLKAIVDNFKECDPSFSLAFMATPLLGIKKLQTSFKKEFLNEVLKLVEKYSELANTNENVEKY